MQDNPDAQYSENPEFLSDPTKPKAFCFQQMPIKLEEDLILNFPTFTRQTEGGAQSEMVK